MLTEMQLGPGPRTAPGVDTGCLSPSTLGQLRVQLVGGVKTALFGGEGLFFATLTGPGHVWLAIAASQPHAIASRSHPRDAGPQGEGSVLDANGIGNVHRRG